jgi:hypothetical protein
MLWKATLNKEVITAMLVASTVAFAQKTAITDYEERLAAYMKIHADAKSHVTVKTPTEAATALAEAIRIRRPNAEQGDIFTPAIAAELRRLAAGTLKKHRPAIRTSIQSGEVVSAAVRVNGAYPKGLPVETMPPSLLAVLPALPKPMKYRLMSNTLVLLDAEDKLVVDFISNFLPAN